MDSATVDGREDRVGYRLAAVLRSLPRKDKSRSADDVMSGSFLDSRVISVCLEPAADDHAGATTGGAAP